MERNIKDNIQSLGIAKSHKCPACSKRENLSTQDRNNLAQCMVNNGAGLWALLTCGHCGWTDTIYPIRINGISCTREECDKLFKEIEKFNKILNSSETS